VDLQGLRLAQLQVLVHVEAPDLLLLLEHGLQFLFEFVLLL
jgi:hypothetical protein